MNERNAIGTICTRCGRIGGTIPNVKHCENAGEHHYVLQSTLSEAHREILVRRVKRLELNDAEARAERGVITAAMAWNAAGGESGTSGELVLACDELDDARRARRKFA